MKKFTCKALEGQEFDSQKAMLTALKENKDQIKAIKRATIKKADGIPFDVEEGLMAQKAVDGLEKGYIYPVINTTLYMDSHEDVHLNGIWNKSVTEQKGKVHYIVNHDMKLGSVIAFPKDVEAFVQTVKWSDLGAGFDGQTEALTFKVPVSAIVHPDAKHVIENKIPAQHSVRMQYVKLELAINDPDPAFKEEFAEWNKHIDKIANKDRAQELGYFWAVYEAKISQEGSMVLLGSNDVTPLLYDDGEPSKHTTQTFSVLDAIKNYEPFNNV